jgi:sugar phosphate isomerase/epimerase
MAKPGVALQLFTVRDELQKDFVGTLRSVAQVGYRAVELVSYFGQNGLSSKDLKGLLADLGLAPIGVHVAARSLENNFDETVGYYLEAGVPDIIAPSLPHEYYADAEGCRRGGKWLRELAGRCQALGAGFAYHNHHADFNRFGDQYGLDLILGSADPPAAGLEADVYWISYAGVDPATIIRRYADRCRFVHLKDKPAVVEGSIEDVMAGKIDGTRLFAEVGEGVVDWPSVFAAAEATPAVWYVVEQDAAARPKLESIAISLRHLKEWGKAQ